MRHGVSPDTFPPRSHEAKRVSVVDAAASVFCREGYAGANIDLIAAEAGVSRQTVYNHHGDKENLFVAVVRDLTERCNAGIFSTIASFPDQPTDLEADLIAFAVRMNRNCICNRDGRFLRKLIQAEGERYPELFAEWREQGPGRTWSALAARFARLAFAGHLSIGDPDVAARQFLALVNAELQITFMLGGVPTEEEVLRSATNGVQTFLSAFVRKKSPAGKQATLVHA
ncbi:TetR family transcriptional regulator [Mesorhizobium sp. M2A.F.Ca.ET.037.01.1.1]|uniref:TetR/AcrR family transcriptional regulator n=1 Tax=unclassified Mesorhizobium TaxID=325217 RepID=UPI000F761C6E|nr:MULTISPECIES: TetR/AcrR family transcriptional regulator [unclassified Mesorhizobium]RUX99201.1 TetR family transcriptional regulator [Mesorhizobium sp. M2A.F.Ca.ET.040.01.1.1]RVC72846.1 TetR family transcriptional regulator [Mesorhizobium sp. M2A.F.Ca.ET.046.02.1.1]AZO37636.1 TetR/AcrR family transcriptional regulator [Mesorhizobium sp. M2A.F.Ca.ET.046.03.2.1]RUX19685.1 TetR family transcriptional regulator [Mesorhizobium sp. M2A.F.Ca.ET.037.01.1.1]RWA94095.1 MAG: TetR family transcription